MLLNPRFANKTLPSLNIYLNVFIGHMNPHFATSRWGRWKGCRCHGCGRSLKMDHIACCVSITTVTCLRGRLRKWGRKGKERNGYWSLYFFFYNTVMKNNNTWQTRQKCAGEINAFHFDHSPPSWAFLWFKDRLIPDMSLWASLSPIVWCNSRWGCRSVTLQQHRVWLFNPIFLLLFFLLLLFSNSPCRLNIYGLVKPTWNRELTNISSVKVLSEGPKFASLQLILWGDGGANSNHPHTAGREKPALFWGGIKWTETCFMSLQPFITFRVMACPYGIPLIISSYTTSDCPFKTDILRQSKRRHCNEIQDLSDPFAPPTVTLPFGVFVMSRSANQPCTKALLSTAHYGTVPGRA